MISTELRKKLAIVGVTGAVFAGGVLGLSSLASAQSPAVSDGSQTEESVPADEYSEAEADELSQFDNLSAEDQELITRFEQCLNDADIGEGAIEDSQTGEDVELTEEQLQAIDAAFEKCETILDDLSFDADDWLEPEEGDWDEADWDTDFSDEDQAVLEDFESCLTETGLFDEQDLDEQNIDQEEPELTDQQIEELEEAFANCEEILEGLSEDADELLDCEDAEEDYDHGEDYDHEEDYEGEVENTLLQA